MALKKYKPTTPGRRQMTSASFDEVTVSKPEQRLIKRLKKHGGRNNSGRITCRHRGGGSARQYRIVDFKRTDKLDVPGTISSLEYDPNRTAYIMLVVYADGDKRYHLAPGGVQVGDRVLMAEKTKVKPGNRLMLKNVPAGYSVYNLEMFRERGGSSVRTAGSSAKILGVEGDFAQVQLPSKEIRRIHKDCFATLGRVSNEEHSMMKIGKAGRKRQMGRRPTVRGKAMNPCDHPHGGGEGACPIGLKHPKTPWGLPALGVKTRRKKKESNQWVVKTRKGQIYK
jgi:large subunit ribosomal protein L2